MNEKENQDLELENIIKEFTDNPQQEAEPELQEEPGEQVQEALPEEEAAESFPEDEDTDIKLWEEMDLPEEPEEAPLQEDLQDTRRMEPIQEESTQSEVTGDTIRLDGLREKLAEHVKNEPVNSVPVSENLEDTIRSEPFSEHWEPEYEQPMGKYVPPQPIQFQPRSRLQELKRKLVAGPEKRFYQLSEKGIGKLQAAIFLSVLILLVSAASTVLYAMGMVQENRMRLLVFGQFLSLLVSALLGSFQIIEGLADLGKKRFTLNTMLAVTFVVCCVDGVLCLRQLRVPCCAAFSLEVTMSLWSAYHRRSTELAQMDTLRKAVRLDGVAVCPEYLEDKKGLLRVEGQVEDFMDHYASVGKPEKRLDAFGLIAMCAALSIGIVAGLLHTAGDGMERISTGVQVAAVSLLAAVPATGFISQSRPTWILERRLHKLGTVLCGWRGVESLCGKAVFPITFRDIYPPETVRMNGMKFFGNREPEQVMEYTAALITSDAGGLSELFTQVLDSHNGRHYDAAQICHYENGGVSGVVENETVLIGSAGFLKDMDVEVPESAKLNYGVYVAIGGELSGLFAVSYEKTKTATAGLSTLNSYRKLWCVLTTNDFMLTHGFLRSKFGVKPKRFLLPECEIRAQLREKTLEEGTQACLMTTARGLASLAYGVTGARMLRTTCRLGTGLHVVGGAVGLGIMILLVVLGALDLLVPVNLFLYHLVWMIPGLLITEWTRSI